jgi:hypothetical protein
LRGVRSLVSAIASVEVRKILDEFGAVLQRIRSADLAITGIEEVERQNGQPVDSKDRAPPPTSTLASRRISTISSRSRPATRAGQPGTRTVTGLGVRAGARTFSDADLATGPQGRWDRLMTTRRSGVGVARRSWPSRTRSPPPRALIVTRASDTAVHARPLWVAACPKRRPESAGRGE